MRNIIQEFLKVLIYSILGLVFAYASFYLILNFYHHSEVNREYNMVVKENLLYNSVQEKINTIKNNISVKNNNYTGSVNYNYLLALKGKLSICADNINNDTFRGLREKTSINIGDMYELKGSYKENVLDACIVSQMYFLTNSSEMGELRPYIKMSMDSLIKGIDYMDKEILNNSSYFFNTNMALNTVKNDVKEDYVYIMSSYSRAVDLLLEVSNWYKEQLGGAQ